MPPRALLAVVGRSLMRVLAVGEVGHLLERERQLLGELLHLAEPVRDRRLVRGRRRERGAGELAPRVERDFAVLAQLAEHDVVLVGRRDGDDVREVLRRGAQHRRPADVDHLDHLGLGRAAPSGDRRERIEADADEVDGLDVVLGERRRVFRQVAPRENPGVDARVQRLDAAAEHLGRLGHLLDPRHVEALLLQERRGAARRDELPAEVGQATREVVDPVFSQTLISARGIGLPRLAAGGGARPRGCAPRASRAARRAPRPGRSRRPYRALRRRNGR